MSAPISTWIIEPLADDVRSALERLSAAHDVQCIAAMPDVHLAHGICIGTVTATSRCIYPGAVGGDIGCGVAGLGFSGGASVLDDPRSAAALLAGLYELIPFIKQRLDDAPARVWDVALSMPAIESVARRDGRLQFGTLGRGNHFLELERDDADGLWLTVHSGSRAIGPAIRDSHLRRALGREPFRYLDADSSEGAAYLADMEWARRYAQLSRRHMLDRVATLLHELFGLDPLWETLVDCDHNHVQHEVHGGHALWVHRKGALQACRGQPAIIPGSMGSASYHVVGRGEAAALCSSSHGAGRAFSRTDARRHVAPKRLLQEMRGIWFDHRIADRLREEGPSAYKDIDDVMRAQHDLTRIVRRLQPLLVYKSG